MLRKLGAVAALVAAGIVLATPAANAGNLDLEIHGKRGSVHISGGPKPSHVDGRPPRLDHYNPIHRIRGCHPGEAVRKAAYHYGLRNAHVDRVGDRFIIVEGFRRGSHVTIGFHRSTPWCEVAWSKRSDRYGYGYGHHHKDGRFDRDRHWRSY